MPGVEEGTLPVPRTELCTLQERNVGAPLPTQDEAFPFVASAGDDSDEDDCLAAQRKYRASIILAVTSPNVGGPDIPKKTTIPTQSAPTRSPAAPEENEDEEIEDAFHTPPPGSLTGCGRHSPPLITSQLSPRERLVLEGQSNVFPPQSVSHYPSK